MLYSLLSMSCWCCELFPELAQNHKWECLCPGFTAVYRLYFLYFLLLSQHIIVMIFALMMAHALSAELIAHLHSQELRNVATGNIRYTATPTLRRACGDRVQTIPSTVSYQISSMICQVSA